STYDSSTDSRVLRGGSWDFDRQVARAAYRYDGRPDSSSNVVGFRLALAPVRPGS
ncbi:MAG: SUMF1/EgtB/PvdO family nonheme iron enzyme, partial [Ktedonobacterales bacterium]